MFCAVTLILITGIYLVYSLLIRTKSGSKGFQNRFRDLDQISIFCSSTLKKRFLGSISEISAMIGISQKEIILDALIKSTVIVFLPILFSQLIGINFIPNGLLFLLSLLICSYWLVGYRKRSLNRYRDQFELEFSDFVDTLSLAVNSGLPFLGAVLKVIEEFESLEREQPISFFTQMKLKLIRGEKEVLPVSSPTPLIRELRTLRGEVEVGNSAQSAFDSLSSRLGSSMVSNFADLVSISLARGTPMAAQLNEYAISLREAQKRSLMERASRAEIKMMIPVVFLLLPISVLFALWPSFQQLQQLVIIP